VLIEPVAHVQPSPGQLWRRADHAGFLPHQCPPLHMTAQEDPKDDIHDWRIRCTVNGESFVFDEWQPFYLKGFEPGTQLGTAGTHR
jgi:hypothetical protein